MFKITRDHSSSRCFFGNFTTETELPTPKEKKGVQSYSKLKGLIAWIFRKAYCLKDFNGERVPVNKNSTISWIKRHETQILDSQIRVSIEEKLKNPTKTNVQLAIKIICEAAHKIPEPPSAEKILESNAFIEKMWQEYKEKTDLGAPASLEQFRIEKSLDTGNFSTVQPDYKLANLPLKLQNDPYTLFLPDVIHPANAEEVKKLTDTLQAAFTIGKEMVVVRFGTNMHAVLGAFSITGEFKLIDSMSSQVINHKELENKLNQAKISNKNGNFISFQGDYINTRIQKGGNTCLRISTLYAYQIAKRRDMDAYQEVNGAFLEGRLNTFEDYACIDGASSRKKTVTTIPASYTKFMNSWAYRSYGYTVDDWRQLPLSDLTNEALIFPNTDTTCINLESKLELPIINSSFDSDSYHLELGLEKGDGVFIPIKSANLEEISYDSTPKTFADAIKNKNVCYILYEKNNPKLKIFNLRPGEKLMRRSWDDNKPEPSIISPFLK